MPWIIWKQGIFLTGFRLRGIFLDGQVTTIIPGKTPCFYCIFPRISKKEVFPVLGATPGVIGSIQANEAVKYLTGKGKLLEGRLLFWSGLSGCFSEISLAKLNNCPVCGTSSEKV
jgi:molybdopterin/thiamine biosynthesis adenylyltransferase